MFNLLSCPAFLRALVWFDASTGLLLGALHLLLTASLAEWLGLPSGLLVVSGVLLLGYAALATRIARAHTMPRGSLWVLIVANFGWALASLALLLGNAVAPTFLGQAYLVGGKIELAIHNRKGNAACLKPMSLSPTSASWSRFRQEPGSSKFRKWSAPESPTVAVKATAAPA